MPPTSDSDSLDSASDPYLQSLTLASLVGLEMGFDIRGPNTYNLCCATCCLLEHVLTVFVFHSNIPPFVCVASENVAAETNNDNF